MSASKHFQDILASRRALLGGLVGLPLIHLAGCATARGPAAANAAPLRFSSVPATNADTISVPPGYRWRPLIAWGDALFENMAAFDADTLTRAEQEKRFGANNDMLALFPAAFAFPPPRGGARALLCANNEYFSLELMFPSLADPRALTAAQVETAFAAIGVTVVELERGAEGWRPVLGAEPGANPNRRITPFTPVQFTGPAARHPWIVAASAAFNARTGSRRRRRAGRRQALRHAGNCAGGQTRGARI